MWELPPPVLPPPGYPPGVLLIFDPYVVLTYIIVVLLSHSKWVDAKICRTEIGKDIIPCSPSTAVGPTKRDAKQVQIELAVLNFRLLSRHDQLGIKNSTTKHPVNSVMVTKTSGWRGGNFAGDW